MGYLFVVIAAIAAGGQFSLSKVYKRLVPSSDFSDLFYNFATGLFSVVIFAIICRGQVGFTAFSFWLAAGVAVCNTIYTICGLKAVYMFGSVRMGKSEAIEFTASDIGEKDMTFTIDNNRVTDLRIVVETEEGTTAQVTNIEMFLN